MTRAGQNGHAEPLDLGAVAARHAVIRVRVPIDWSGLAASISLGDVTDISEATGIDPMRIAQAIDTGGPGASLELGTALAWVILRREIEGLTFDAFRSGYMIEGPPEDPTAARRPTRRRSAPRRSSAQPGSSEPPA